MRAVHQIHDDAPRILDDPVSARLVDGVARVENLATNSTWDQPVPRLARSQVVFRSRASEDALATAVANGFGVYVIVGAGLDSFAYRQPAWGRKIRIIEIDHPASQSRKRACLVKAEIAVPENVVFRGVDLNKQTLEEALDGLLDGCGPVFFSWLGVTQYLPPDALEKSFRFVTSLPVSTEVVLTFNLPERVLEGDDLLAARLGASSSAAAGEPWVSCFDFGALRHALLQCGFRQCHHLTPELAFDRYFAGRSDGLRPSRLQQLAHAVV